MLSLLCPMLYTEIAATVFFQLKQMIMKNLEKFAAFNETLSAAEMQVCKGGQNFTVIKFSQEITAAGTWITEDYYVNGKYSYSSTSPDHCK